MTLFADRCTHQHVDNIESHDIRCFFALIPRKLPERRLQNAGDAWATVYDAYQFSLISKGNGS